MLAGIVWKSFERTEAVLTDDTKLGIAVWLLGLKVAEKVEPWPGTFATMFDRVFGKRFRSWRCFFSSSIASVCLSIIIMALDWSHERAFELVGVFVANKPTATPSVTHLNFGAPYDVIFYLMPLVLLYTLCGNVWFDYLSLGVSKRILKYVVGNRLSGWKLFLSIVADACGSALCGAAAVSVALWLGPRFQEMYPHHFVGLVDPDYDFVGGFDLSRF